MDKFVFDSGHDYEYAFYINDRERPEFCVNGQM